MKVSCPDCGARWTGQNRQHCRACCRTFNSTAAGDKHRVGSWTKEHPRRCIDEAEMVAAGMFERDGIWYAKHDRRDADSHPHRENLAGERDQGGVPT